jgi:P2 family phage contractile tail tube protein
MATTQLDYILQQFIVSIDGYGKAGTGEQCTLPKIRKQVEKYRGGGMIAPRQHALGYQEFEFEVTLSSVDPQVIGQSGLLISKAISFSVMGYLDGDNNASHTVYIYMRGEVIENDFGQWEAGKKATLKIKVALDACSMTIDGDEIFSIDIMNGVNQFNGTDVGALVAAAIGS